jgi:hypothetical protein
LPSVEALTLIKPQVNNINVITGPAIAATTQSTLTPIDIANRLIPSNTTFSMKLPAVSAQHILALHPATGQLASITTHPIPTSADEGTGVQYPYISSISNVTNTSAMSKFPPTENWDRQAPTITQSNQHQQGNQSLTQQIISQFLNNTLKPTDT